MSENDDGMYVTCYRGINSVLFAMNLDKDKSSNLAGFSIHCVTPDKGPYDTSEYCLPNFLDFEHSFETDNKLNCNNKRGSNKRPFQTFHWIHFPSAGPGKYVYSIYAAYFHQGKILHPGPEVTFNLNIDGGLSFDNFELGFTRGYVSSQAYTDRYEKNTSLYPVTKTLDFDTEPYLDKYKWLGSKARELIFETLGQCENDESMELDVFAFELSEPDIVRSLVKLGNRLRLFQDDSTGNNKPSSLERKASQRLESAGAAIKKGHFGRLAHDKIMIQKKNGKPVKVLTGSANFSLRGLYVQPNSILVFHDTDVADIYEQAFEKAFTAPKSFRGSPIASKWFDIEDANEIPRVSVSFAPHKTPKDEVPFPLETVAKAIESANSSVFFAIMAPQGKGPVISELKNLASRKKLFSLGIVDKASSLSLFKGGVNAGTTAYGALTRNVPEPFKRELSSLEKVKAHGFSGVVIHHKFVVCDFNDKNPVVFCGSSNLSEGGEKANGDNLLEIRNREVAVAYAVESVRLYDHYRFRSTQVRTNHPIQKVKLKETDEWAKPYYDPTHIKYHERELLAPKNM